MNIVKDKKMLCQTSLADFSVENVNDVPFYRRWPEFVKLFTSRIKGIDFEKYFAQPNENPSKKTIEWFFVPREENPVRLSDLKEQDVEEYSKYVDQRQNVVAKIKTALKSCNENEAKYFKAAIVNLEADYVDSVTYCYDGHILFGVWGMRTKVGRQIDSVITEGVQDHRAFRINYQLEGEGEITPFSYINRRYGHILTGDDIPNVIPAQGWSFVEWSPEAPHGKVVKDKITYVAICKQQEVPVAEDPTNEEPLEIVDESTSFDEPEIPPQEPEEEHPTEEEKKKYTVLFNTDKHGSLSGQTRYEKYDGEEVLESEIPEPEADEGFEFAGWDKEPKGHVVHDNIEFTARYRKLSVWSWRGGFWRALLHWLLLLLLLVLLFLLIWCVFFDKCHLALCKEDCHCDEEVVVDDNNNNNVVDPPKPPDYDPDRYDPIIQKPCNEDGTSGGKEININYYEMGQSSGSFQFDYDTEGVPDEITIYDGQGTDGKVIFYYPCGGTHTTRTQIVNFNQSIITVKVVGCSDGTHWSYYVHCPQ